jgi:hypothetical protein
MSRAANDAAVLLCGCFTGAAAVWVTPWALLIVPAGIIIAGAATGIARGLRNICGPRA